MNGEAAPGKPNLQKYAFHIACLAVIAGYFLIFPVYRGFFLLENGVNESWNAYLQDRAFGGGPLYPPVTDLFANNYPPLSFYVIGGIASWAGDALFVGRALSLVATLGLGFIVAILVKQFHAGWPAAALAGVWFVATMAGPFDQSIVTDDPQLFGQFLMGCALVWFVHRDGRGASADGPILLMVLAGFWKHNIIGIPATVVIWLVLRDRWHALRPLLVGVGGVIFGFAICFIAYGDVFFANLLAPRAYGLWRLPTALGRLQFGAPALFICAIWVWRERQTARARFIALFILVALAAHFVQWSGAGIGNGSQIDLIIAVSVGLGLAYDRASAIDPVKRWSSELIRSVIVAILALRIVLTGHIESGLLLTSANYRRAFSDHAAITQSEALRVRGIPGLVACSNELVCRVAGKSLVLDDFKVGQLLLTGQLTPNGLSELLKIRGITFVQNDPRANAESVRRDWIAKVFRGEQWD
jgi:hypothetical protein